MKRIDERDTMFARMEYKRGTPGYEEYYNRKPHLKEQDDEIRSRPQLCSEDTATYHPTASPIALANFNFLGDIKHLAEGKPNPNKLEIDPTKMSERLKGLAQHYGAVLVGIAELAEHHYYSHRGRHPEDYGQEVTVDHPYGIVFAVEMDKSMINRAPQLAEIIETSKGYVEAAIIGMLLSYYIRELGYQARNHMDANYLVVSPLVAKAAGLGDIGRNGILITKEYGSRVRLGVVTTDMPLVADGEVAFGLEQFCQRCQLCALTCPGRAIPTGSPQEIEGVKRWQIKQEDCYKMWRHIGTDCGICIASCPFSQGLELKDVESFKDNPERINEILNKHKKEHGIRKYIKDPPEWL